jgi:hypothetical protein
MDDLASQLSILSGLTKGEILVQLGHDTDYDRKARYEFKHTIGNRYSGLNPTIFINGARVDNGKNIKLDDWKKLISSLLNNGASYHVKNS